MNLVATISQKRDVEVRVAMLRLVNNWAAASPTYCSVVRSLDDLIEVLDHSMGELDLERYEGSAAGEARLLRAIAMDMTRNPSLRRDLQECFERYTGTVIDPPTESVSRAALLLLLWSEIRVNYTDPVARSGLTISLTNGALSPGITSQLDALLTS